MAFYPAQAPVFVPSTSPTSVGLGVSSLSDDTTGGGNTAIGNSAGSLVTTGTNNTLVGNSVASTTLATGSNNIVIGTSSAADTVSGSTSNTLWIGGGSTAVMSATGINSTPAVTIPGTLSTGGISGIGTSIGVVSSGFTGTGSTLATITGMVLTLPIGTYILDGYISCQCAATPGIKLAFLAGGAGASAIQLDTWIYSTSTLTAQAAITSLGSNLVSAAVAATSGYFSGTVVISTAGTLTMQAAQSVSNATVLTIANNSYMTANRIA